MYIGGIKNDGSDGEPVGTRLFLPHPEYDNSLKNSIMLIFLNSTSTSPTQKLNFDANIPKRGDKVTTIGFGRESIESGKYNGTLRKVQYSVRNIGWNAINLGRQKRKRFVYVGEPVGKKGICIGDFGGPVINEDGIQVAMSLTYSILGCGSRFLTQDIHPRVSYYKSFMQDNLCKYSTVPPSDCPSEKKFL